MSGDKSLELTPREGGGTGGSLGESGGSGLFTTPSSPLARGSGFRLTSNTLGLSVNVRFFSFSNYETTLFTWS